MHLSFLITIILFLIFISTAIFILTQNPKKESIWCLSGSMICGAIYLFILVLRFNVLEVSEFILLNRIFFIPAELGTFLWFLSSVKIKKEFGILHKFDKIFPAILFGLNIIACFALTFTNTIVNFEQVGSVGTLTMLGWGKYVTRWYWIRIILNLIKTILPIVNFALILRVKKHLDDQKSIFYLFLASIIFFLGVMWGVVCYRLDISSPEVLRNIVLVQSIFLLPSMLIVAYVLIFYDAILEQKSGIAKEFIIKFLINIVLGLIYVSFVLLALNVLNKNLLLPFIITIILGLSLITHEIREFFIQSISDSVKARKIMISSVLNSDVMDALKNWASPNSLSNNRLLKIKKVLRFAKKNSCTKVKALRYLIKNSIEGFKPIDDSNRRTLTRLKYEILRMVAFEGATESQIMWDLGFDVYTRSVEEKLSETREPRFKLKDPSEYSATSIRSFKRLKKEAIEMLRWKLEE